MAKKPQKEDIVMTAKINGEDKALLLYNTTLEEAPIVFKSFSSAYTGSYEDSSRGLSVRDGFDRYDYEQHRPEEGIPTDDKGKIVACMREYETSGNGIVKNIVDLIGDLVVQGIDIVHSKKKNEKFAKVWFHKTINGTNLSERFVNTLCRAGNVIVKRDTQQIPLRIATKYYKGLNKSTTDFEERTEIQKREIPVRYRLLDVRIIEIMNADISMLLDGTDMQFGLNIPNKLSSKIINPNASEISLVNLIPPDIVTAVRGGMNLIPLDKDKVKAYYYKKDDWRLWATPMIYTVLSDLYNLKKMKLADVSCLDGVLSQIRIWKIGDLATKQRPTLAAMTRLASSLRSAAAGGILDLIWGPDLEMKEVTSNLHNFLGETKYTPIINAIHSGLGIPPLFNPSSSASFTNNFLAIKTFIVRLEYLRNVLKGFWEKELGLLAKALGWTEAPVVVFDRLTLNDESSILQIMLHMVDRGLLSDEAMQEMVGAIPEIENIRTKREYKERKSGKRAPKASPFERPDYEHGWIEKFIQMGEVTPSEVGLELDPRKPSEKTPNQNKVDLGILGPKKLANDLTGRPVGKKDTTKRKQKVVKPSRGVGKLMNLVAWSIDFQDKLNEYITPVYLNMLEKKNLRQLTDQETKNLEDLKFTLLANIEPNTRLTENTMKELIAKEDLQMPEYLELLSSQMINDYTQENGEMPNIHQIRRMQALCYAAYHAADESEECDQLS